MRWVIFVSLCLSATCAAPAEPTWILSRGKRENSPKQPGKAKELSTSPDLYSVRVESLVQLRYATTQFSYRIANPATRAQEVLFQVILPETAFISSFLMVIKGKTYRATIKEKEKAQAEYSEAVAAGQSAAQVATSARDSNKFEVSVNLEAGSKGTFNLTYEELLPRRASQYELAINLQFKQIVKDVSVRVNILETPPATGIRVKELRTNDHELFDIPEGIATIEKASPGNVQIDYRPTTEQQLNVSPEGLRKFIVQYSLENRVDSGSGGVLHVIDGYFVHFFAPPIETPLHKHVVFILDVSGSMFGKKLEQTKQAMHLMLDQIQETDYISVIDFSDSTKIWDLKATAITKTSDQATTTTTSTDSKAEVFNRGVLAFPASSSNILRAKSLVNALEAYGGTNINEAALEGIKLVKQFRAIPPKPVTPLIVFLTDGEATTGEINADQILVNIRSEDSDRLVSLFSLGFGTGADFELLKKISLQNKGFARRIYEDADAALQLGEFFRDIASPALTDVEFKYANGTVASVTSPALATYFGGGELVVAGQLKDANALPVATVEGLSSSGQYSQKAQLRITSRCFPYDNRFPYEPESASLLYQPDTKCPYPTPFPPTLTTSTVAPPTASTSPGAFLERFWSYLTIKDLLRKADLNETEPSYKAKALELSLKYGFVTPLTSLLVVKPNSSSVAGPQPASQSSTFSESPFAITPLSISHGGISGINSPDLAWIPSPPQPLGISRPQAVTFRPAPPLIHQSHPHPTTTTFRPFTSIATSPIYAPSTEAAKEVVETLHPGLQLAYSNATHVEFIKEGVSHVLLIGAIRPPRTEQQACSYLNHNGVNVTGICVAPWQCLSHPNDSFPRQTKLSDLSEEDTRVVCFDRQQYWGSCCPKDQVKDLPGSLQLAPPQTTEYAPEPAYPPVLKPISFKVV